MQERVIRYEEHKSLSLQMVFEHSRAEGDAVITDLRDVPETYVGNRHVVYALYPCKILTYVYLMGKIRSFASSPLAIASSTRTSNGRWVSHAEIWGRRA